MTGTATWSEYITKLLTMIGSGNSPDMVMMAIEGVRQLIDNDVVMPLDDRIEGDEDMQAVLDDISPRLVEALAVDGQTYFFPNSWNSIVLYYNTKMFADAGLEAPPLIGIGIPSGSMRKSLLRERTTARIRYMAMACPPIPFL